MKKNSIWLLVASLLMMTCTNRNSIKNDGLIADSLNIKAKHLNQEPGTRYADDSLQNFLNNISLNSSIKKTSIVLLKQPDKGNFLRFKYNSSGITVIVTEIKIEGSYYGIGRVSINGNRTEKFIKSEDDIDNSGMVLNDSGEDSLHAEICRTPAGDFLLLNGDNRTARSPNMRNIQANFLIPINGFSGEGYFFSNLLYMPHVCFIGYKKQYNRLIYLDIQGGFSQRQNNNTDSASGEWIYDIYATGIDVKTHVIRRLEDSTGKIYHIKIAVPNRYDNSKYSVVESNWWNTSSTN